MNAKKYNNIKLGVGIAKSIVSFALILAFVITGYSLKLESYFSELTTNNYLMLLLFTAVIGIVTSLLFFPVKYYIEYYLEHKYELSNHTIKSWLWEDFKGLLVGMIIGIPLLLAFYFALDTFGSLWWLPFSILMFLVSVVLARIVPVVILPLFYKIVPIENDELKERILNLAGKVGMQVENVFSFNMSKNTKKANAAFTGLGKTKRIILGDTLLNDYSNDEIETVIAHELGHYKHKHIIKNIIISTISSFLMFFLIAFFYDLSLSWFNFTERTTIAALPLLTLWGMLIGLVITPAGNIVSRKFEYEADQYAIESTNKKDAFVQTLNKLTKQNLGDEEPHPFIEWFFYSHPSIRKRIDFINSL